MNFDQLRQQHNSQATSRKRPSFEEYQIQAEFFKNIRLVYPKLDKLVFHISNEGKRNKKYVKSTGLTKGVADVLLSVANASYHGFYIEFKTQTGKQSPDQQAFQQQVEKAGYKYQVCRSASEAFTALKHYLNNTK